MRYYFYNNTDKYGRHEIHTASCSFLPKPENRTYIGDFSTCKAALLSARIKFPDKKFDGCYYCCNSCHKG